MSQDKGRPLPKFGEWDVNDPASAEGFTVIFNKARDERKTGGNTRGPDSPAKEDGTDKHGAYASKPSAIYCDDAAVEISPAPPAQRKNGFAACNQARRSLEVAFLL